MAVLVVAILSAFFQVLFQRLASIDVVDFIRRRDMEKEVNSLKMSLRNVNLFLNDAEKKQYKDELVKKWLDDLRDASYDAEDVIDELATEAKTSSVQAINSTVQTVLAVPMLDKIKAIIARFNELEGERSILGLKEIDESQVYGRTSSKRFVRETSSGVDESQVYYGRDDDKEKILVQLLKEDNELCRIIPITGMGGVGKTTLAQLVYNDDRVKNHFDLKAWVCVSDNFDIKRITKAILESLTLAPCLFNDLNSLQVRVKEKLAGKKFLIILDDVWDNNYEYWEDLRRPFGVGVAGSAIIVTTRDNEIASMMGTVDRYYLQQLSEVDCWCVFAAVGKEIVRKCKGLPLAAKSLGGLLRTKKERCEWKIVLNSKIWDLPVEENGILPVLKEIVVGSSSTSFFKSFGPDDGECLNSDEKFEEKEDIDEAVVEREEELDDDCLSSSRMVVTVYSVSPNGKFRHNIESWQKGDFLGSGSFGTVYEGYTDNGFFFAVKEVSLLDPGSHGQQCIHQLEQEISLLSQFEHENIVQYLGTNKDETRLYIFLELVTKGSLASLYQKYNLRDSQVSAYTRQILNGLKYLHERNVVHRDIKCANILVDASGSVKLADFGLAKATKLNDVKSCKGTAFWMAPEVVNRKKNGYGLAADIWSLGCTVLEMLTRRIPYSHLEGELTVEILLEPNPSILYDAWIWILGSIGLDIGLIYRKYYPYTTALMLPENYYIVEVKNPSRS